MGYRPTIGLEIHAELATHTKMFCGCANDPDETKPNTNVCPVCLAHPGTLPVINREAVQQVLRVGVAVGGTLATVSEFDRKSYFYPDIPKGYQISQYARPLVTGGTLAGIELTRIHLEEDTARSVHAPDKGQNGTSFVDFNRAGVPLMELVTEPVIHDAATAGMFARELQLLLRTLGAGEANLEKGEMRIEANVSIAPSDTATGTKVEVKNLNSFHSVERAIAYEIQRQTALLEKGKSVAQETRGWDEAKQKTFLQRSKEGSADYRYFPEPDLPSLFLPDIADFSLERLHSSLSELPWERRARYIEAYALAADDAAYLAGTPMRSAFFDSVVKVLGADTALISLAAHYIVSDLAGIYAKHGGEAYAALEPDAFAKLIQLTGNGSLSSRGAKDVLALLVEKRGDPEQIAREHNLMQIHDVAALDSIADTILKQEESAAQEYREGKEAALKYLIGAAMRESRGAGNPQEFQRIFKEKLQ